MDMEQIASYLQTGMWGIVALLTVAGVFKGWRRGLFRQLVRSLTVFASYYVSLSITKTVYETATSWVTEKGAEGVISTLEGYGLSLGSFADILVKLGADSINHVMAIPLSLLVLPLAFVLSFILLKAVLRIVHALVCGILGFRKWRNNFLTRLLGMGLGAVTGLMVAVVCLSPFVGIVNTCSDAVAKYEASDEENEDIKKIYDEYIKPLSKNTCAETLGPLGASSIYEQITTLDVNGKTYNVPKELTDPAVRLVGVLKSFGDFDFANMNDESKAALNSLIDILHDSPYMATLFADVLDVVAREFDGKTGEGDSPLADSLGQILSIFIDIEPDEVAPTLEIVRDSLFLTSMNYQELTEEDRAAFNTLIQSADEDEFKAEALAKILDAVANGVESGSIIGDDLRGNLVKAFFTIFVDIPADDVVPTLEVVRDVLFMLDDEEVLFNLGSNTALLSDKFAAKDENGDNLIARVTGKLNSHDRTKPLVESITKLSIKIISESMPKVDGVEITDETYDSVKGGVNTGIVGINQKYKDVELVAGTPEYEEYVGEVSDTLSSTLEENGIVVDDAVADEMAKYVAENHKDQVEELSDQELNDIILSYYAAHGNTQGVPEIPEN